MDEETTQSCGKALLACVGKPYTVGKETVYLDETTVKQVVLDLFFAGEIIVIVFHPGS